MLATLVMSGFEQTLSERISIAFFVPGIVYLADAIGTRTDAIAVWGLSLSHAPIGSLLRGELRTGILLGSMLGLLTFPLVWISFGDLRLATAVSLSLMATGAVATTMGLLLPWLLHRLGLDPAFGSGPIATIVQDVLSLDSFLFVVAMFA
jgi:magnesium transporter